MTFAVQCNHVCEDANLFSYFDVAEWTCDCEFLVFQHVMAGDIFVGGRVVLAAGTGVLLERTAVHVVAWVWF